MSLADLIEWLPICRRSHKFHTADDNKVHRGMPRSHEFTRLPLRWAWAGNPQSHPQQTPAILPSNVEQLQYN